MVMLVAAWLTSMKGSGDRLDANVTGQPTAARDDQPKDDGGKH
jgi:hypothetical protein